MTVIDIIILLCIIPALVHGFIKGFIAQLTALVAIVLGTWLAFKFSNALCLYLKPYWEAPEQIIHVILFIVIMVVVILILHLIGKLLNSLIKIVLLGWLNRLLGVVFALITVLLVLGVVIILFNTLNVKFEFVKEEHLAASVLYTHIKDFAYTFFPYFKELLMLQ